MPLPKPTSTHDVCEGSPQARRDPGNKSVHAGNGYTIMGSVSQIRRPFNSRTAASPSPSIRAVCGTQRLQLFVAQCPHRIRGCRPVCRYPGRDQSNGGEDERDDRKNREIPRADPKEENLQEPHCEERCNDAEREAKENKQGCFSDDQPPDRRTSCARGHSNSNLSRALADGVGFVFNETTTTE